MTRLSGLWSRYPVCVHYTYQRRPTRSGGRIIWWYQLFNWFLDVWWLPEFFRRGTVIGLLCVITPISGQIYEAHPKLFVITDEWPVHLPVGMWFNGARSTTSCRNGWSAWMRDVLVWLAKKSISHGSSTGRTPVMTAERRRQQSNGEKTDNRVQGRFFNAKTVAA